MNSPTTKDLRRLLDLMAACHESGLGGGTDMPADVLDGVGRLIGSDTASWNRVDHTVGRMVDAQVTPDESNLVRFPTFHHAFDQHPGLTAFRTGRLTRRHPAAWSDFSSSQALRRLPLYVDFFHARGTRDQLLCVTNLDRRHGMVLAFDRSRRGFSSRDRSLMQIMSTHLGHAHAIRTELTRMRNLVDRRGNADPTIRAAEGIDHLTPRERQVVIHLTAGCTDREIAQRLAISERTVHKHLERIYGKLGVHSRTQAMALLK